MKTYSTLWVCFIGLLVSACATTPPPQPAPAPIVAEKEPEPEPEPNPEPPQEWSMLERASDHYGLTATALEPTGEETYLAEMWFTGLRKKGEAPELDNVLISAARELSYFIAENQVMPPSDFFDFTLLWSGSYDIKPEFMHYSYEEGTTDYGPFLEHLKTWSKKVLQRGRPTHVGVGIYRLPPKTAQDKAISYITFLAARRDVKLEPVMKILQPTKRFFLEGRLADPDAGLTTYLKFMDDTVFDAPIPIYNGSFKTELQLPSARAIYRMEIVAEKNGAKKIAASFPLYSRLKPENKYTIKPIVEPCSDNKACTRLLYETLDDMRMDKKLGKLGVHKEIAAVSQEHAQEMLRENYSAITNKQGLRIGHTLAQRNIKPIHAVRFVDGDYSMKTILNRIKASPSIASLITNNTLTDMGCAVETKHATSSSKTYYCVSCGLAVMVDQRDEREIAAAILDLLNSMRKRNGKPDLLSGQVLEPMAQEAAEKLAINPNRIQEVQGELLAQIEDSGQSFERATFHVATVYNVAQISALSIANEIMKSKAKYLAIGVKRSEDLQTPVQDATVSPRVQGIIVYFIAYY